MATRLKRSAPAGYSGTPLAQKLGIKPDEVTLLRGAPRGFEASLSGLPDGARVTRRLARTPELLLWFVRRIDDLRHGLDALPGRFGNGVWIIWPKKSGALASDLSESDVRRADLDAGLVDYKVCAVDDDWNGLKFAHRKNRGKRT